MKESIDKFSPHRLAFAAAAVLALLLSAGAGGGEARAQGGNEPAAQTPGVEDELNARRRGQTAAGLLRILNLTPEQRARIGAIRRETEPQGRLLGVRLRRARRALDEAIYAASPDEGVVEERLREVSEAQAAVVRLRSLTELRIRRVLSPGQLDAFRRLQRQTRTRRQRRDRLSPGRQAGPPDDAPAARLGNRMERRRREQQQQQQRLP